MGSDSRHTPPDWFPALCKMCAQQGLSLYLLGAQPGVIEKVVKKIKTTTPEVKIAGLHHGYFDKTLSSNDQKMLMADINHIKPHFLVVGFGMPAQEKWILENKDFLDVGALLAVGAMFDYLAGTTPRVPRWMTDHGLEWLGRLMIEPGRLWKRYLIGKPIFLWRVFKQRVGWEKYNE